MISASDLSWDVDALGEALVLFRDLSGHLSLPGRHCAHRRASLEYGIIEGIGSIALRIRDEEKLFNQHFPQAYPEYQKQTPALIPWLF